ncbi:hypothetical protein [Seleniivibrio sp.]|uniref:hypothetical protein n=1 Tax=Seleniivibrio sp. TaxID=2898801 RepID=UPI0025D47A1C|nr:hypothetical protein [Seleniivibrio sp.]MCD8553022.1 hypothetical protein [Seleniivibrio sp.]
MKNLIIILTAAVLLYSCASKPQSSPDFLYGSRFFNVYMENYLKGEPKVAESYFYKAEAQFRKVDSLCNLSRIYLGRYVLEEGEEDPAVLELAKKYADLGACEEEQQSVLYLTGQKYDGNKLPEPFRTIEGTDREKLAYIATDSKFDDVTKTRLLRKAAIDYIIDNPKRSEELAEKALELDKYHGWSLNLLRDLIIIKNARIKQGKNADDIATRIELIKSVMVKK